MIRNSFKLMQLEEEREYELKRIRSLMMAQEKNRCGKKK